MALAGGELFDLAEGFAVDSKGDHVEIAGHGGASVGLGSGVRLGSAAVVDGSWLADRAGVLFIAIVNVSQIARGVEAGFRSGACWTGGWWTDGIQKLRLGDLEGVGGCGGFGEGCINVLRPNSIRCNAPTSDCRCRCRRQTSTT